MTSKKFQYTQGGVISITSLLDLFVRCTVSGQVFRKEGPVRRTPVEPSR